MESTNRKQDPRGRRAAHAPAGAAAPENPTDMAGKSWWAVLRRTMKEVAGDDLGDRAAALTYYGV
ncbi:ribonuclease BN, partial [Streptomyces sp. NPDC051907]